MKKSTMQTAVVFAACLVGVGVLHHITAEADNEKHATAYVAEVKEDPSLESISIGDEEVPMTDEIALEEGEVTPPYAHGTRGNSSAAAKPTTVKTPSLGVPTTSKFPDALGLAVKYGKAKWNLTKSALSYAYQMHNIKEDLEDELKLLAIHTVVEHVANSDKLNTIVTIVGTVDQIHDNIKDDVDAIADHIEERHDEIVAVVDHIEERHDEIKENVENVVNHVEERHDEIKENVDAVVDHIEERHDEIKENVDTVVDHIEERHDEIKENVDTVVDHVEERHDEIKENVDAVVDHVEERHEAVKDLVDEIFGSH